ncbi:hypothetical protein C8F04DRAFT_1126383 [Mycena alexandri]|uniref:NADH dehydrogenase [ubiquinone] iron-sulfur protein 5 n=1 Tax=Mycena alexandri TaxID=1745969 RepID=A0AAD6S4G7_9AGAR|nr:hypothetical protein C8F04DRAFT_1142014 [Mycena alexandri]KAJ7026169.1 hypothetical protein C8F04DRAFT_1126383 [Mycena alexandri]
MSGYSYTGGPSRCSAFWREFTKCYATAESPGQCVLQRDDYMECISGKKEKARLATIQAEHEKRQARALKDHKHEIDARADGVPTRVGLVPTPPSDAK